MNSLSQLIQLLGEKDISGLTEQTFEADLKLLFPENSLIQAFSPISAIGAGLRVFQNIRAGKFEINLYKFLYELHDIPVDKRVEFLKKKVLYNEESIGEKIFLLMSREDNSEKFEIIGKLFTAMTNEQIDPIDYLLLVHIVDRSYLGDLIAIPKWAPHGIGLELFEREQKQRWFTNGLLNQVPIDNSQTIKVKLQARVPNYTGQEPERLVFEPNKHFIQISKYGLK